MGMLVFMKNFLLRAIEREMVRNYSVKEMLRELSRRPMAEQAVSIKEVQQKIADEDPGAGEVAARMLRKCRPRIVINMGEDPDDSKMAFKISQILGEILSIEADYFGFVFKDRSVLTSIRRRHPFLPNYRNSVAAENIVRMARRVEKFWDQPVKDSAALLFNHVQKDIDARPHPA
jgi:MinD-like ATPase involved in chromosome partitioning or flagellar assembly